MKQHLKNTFLLLPIAASLPVQAQDKNESPNLVFIMADQWRGDALGCLDKEVTVSDRYLSDLHTDR